MPPLSQAEITRRIRSLSRRDAVLGRAIRRLPRFPRLGGRSSADSHFHSLARTIIHQQLAGAAAATIHERVHALTDGPRFPVASELLAMPVRRLRGAGLSEAKVRSILDLADRVESGALKLRSIARLEDQEVIQRLVEVRGIGVWSAQMFLMFRLGRPDVMPAGDLGVQEGMRLLDGLTKRPGPRAVEARAEIWSPDRSLATWYLYRLVDEAREAG